MTLKITAPVLALTLALAGCANQAGQPGVFGNGSTGSIGGSGIGGGEAVGTLAGAGLGAWAGSNIGGGSGKLAATALGLVAGGFIGNRIGNSLDKGSIAYANQATQKALETAPAGQQLPWRNDQNGNHGYVVAGAYQQQPSGVYCREYTQTVFIGGQQQQAVGTACRNPDGTWTPTA
jgi:surface antigen